MLISVMGTTTEAIVTREEKRTGSISSNTTKLQIFIIVIIFTQNVLFLVSMLHAFLTKVELYLYARLKF